jgi:hypothetical protein
MDARRAGTRLLAGAVAGGLAWVAGLLVTGLVSQALGDPGTGPTVTDAIPVETSPLSLLGLLYLAAHFVAAEPSPPIADPFNLVDQLASAEPGYTALYLVPPVALLVAGGLLARRFETPLVGALPVVGYLPPTAVGAALFRIEFGGLAPLVFQAPPLTAAVVAGAAYPLVCGLAGAAAVALFGRVRAVD